MRSVVFWRAFATLTFLVGVFSLFDPPTSFVRADVADYLKVTWSVLMITGGAAMLTPFTLVELAGLMLPITAEIGWSVVLISLGGSWSTVVFSAMFVLIYWARFDVLRRQLNAAGARRRR